MNALVGIGANASGLRSANPAKRLEVLMQVQSLARARMFGATRDPSLAGSVTGPAGKSNVAKAGETDSGETTGVVGKELDRDAFLRLLVTQMQNQDPMSPMDNTEMIAQLAQFSSLEQMNNLNQSFTAMSGNVDQLNFITANSLLGRHITGVDVDGEAVSGEVERVHLDGSIVYLTVDDRLVSMAGVGAIGALDDTAD